jgi:two-component system OmpR family response regulator
VERLKILLVDDDVEQTSMLAEYLVGEGFSARAVYTPADGLAQALSGQDDAVLLDVMMPGGSGLDVLRAIRAQSDIPIVMLTAKGNDTERVVGLELGADDYITKPYYPRELAARLRAVLRRPGRADHRAERATPPGLTFDTRRRRVEWRGRPFNLTATEFNMLEMLLRGSERVSTKDELSLRLLGRRHETYDRSIDVHVSNLRLKLQQATDGALKVDTVRGVGWRLSWL